MKTLLRFALALSCGALLTAADVSGKWKVTFTIQDQTRENDLVMKAEGEKVSGTLTSPMLGDAALQDGKTSGDQVSFFVIRNFGGNEMKMIYKGKVSGEEIKFQVEGGQFNFDAVAKRVK